MSLYDSQTQELILQRMLSRVASKYDKREGSIIFDSTAPASVEFQNFYIALDSVLKEVFADTASREYLIKRCAERGITPKPATYATVMGKFTPETLDLPIGTRFSHEDLNYVVTDKVSDGYYHLQCEMVGSVANGVVGQLIPIDYVDGLTSAQIVEVSILGDDEEDTENLRARYFASLTSEVFGGNRLDYKTKVLAMDGVGGVKIYSGADWNGGGTVKLVIVDSEHGVPTFDLINEVQTKIDPEANSGEGVGIAPIGHFVTVVGAYNTVINIDTSLTFEDGYSWTTLKTQIETAIDDYFKTLNAKWQDLNKITVILSRLESHILNVEGVIDIRNTKLNGKDENLSVDKDSLISRGTVNVQ